MGRERVSPLLLVWESRYRLRSVGAAEAAVLGVWLHGRAGELLAQEMTAYCASPRELVTRGLGLAFRELLEA